MMAAALRRIADLKISDVARYLGIHPNSVYKMTGPKSVLRMPHMRIAGKVRFRKADIDQWLDHLMVSTNDLLAGLRGNIDGKACRN
jgi:excisionase family DNA binding protein